MGRDGSCVIQDGQAPDSPLPTPGLAWAPRDDVGWQQGWRGLGSLWGTGPCLWTAAASLGLPAAPRDGGIWCHHLPWERAWVPLPDSCLPQHQTPSALLPSIPTLSGDATSVKENRKPPDSVFATPRFTPAPWVPAAPLTPIPSHKSQLCPEPSE